MKRIFALLFFASIALTAIAKGGMHLHGNPLIFSQIQVGGAGAVIGVSSVPSQHIILAKTDQFGCYKSIISAGTPGNWQQLVTVNAFPIGVAAINSNGAPLASAANSSGGCDEAVSDPSSASKLWLGVNGSVFRSSDGTNFVNTCYSALGPSGSPGNTPGLKGFGPYIAVDPNNSSVVYMSTPHGGLVFTSDNGNTCSTVSAVGTGGSFTFSGATVYGGHLIAFDTSGGTTTVGGQTRTKNVYVSTYGTGVYLSIDGGQTWTLKNSAGMPTTHIYMTADGQGNLWFVDNVNGNGVGTARKYNGTAWSNPNGGAITVAIGVAVDPNACAAAGTCHLTYCLGGGAGASGTATTTDGGSSWNTAQTITFSTNDVPWIKPLQDATGIFPAGCAYDESGRIHTGGEGSFYATPPTAGSAVTFTSHTVGIEESLSSAIVSSPTMSGKIVLGTWDVNCFYLSGPFTSFPSNPTNRGCYSPNANELQHTYGVDWASGATSTLVALTDNQQGYGGGTYHSYWGISTDGGATWSSLSQPAGIAAGGYKGGYIAASTASNIMVAPTDGVGGSVAPYYTTNGGSTWSQISVTGATGGWPFSYLLPSRQIAADRVTANQFYLYNFNVGDGGGDAFIKCTASGATCTIQARPGWGPNQQYYPQIKTVPGQAGYFFAGYGNTANSSTTGAFGYSSNSGTTFTAISGFAAIDGFGFGAVPPGHTFPAIMVVGFKNGVYGFWRSKDWDGAQTWQQVGTYPLNYPAAIMDIDGDKTNQDVWYITTSSGAFCLSPSATYCNGVN